MKKKFLSFALIISILSSLFAAFPMAASATESAEEMPVSINSVYCYYKEGKVKASVRFDYTNEAGTVFLAVYDEGKLINIGQDTFEKDKKAKGIEITGVDESYIGYDVKVFCWGRENSMIPIATPFTEQITDYATTMARILNAVSDNIDIYTDRSRPEYNIFLTAEKKILRLINECIDDAVVNHVDELDDNFSAFVEKQYEDKITTVRETYDRIQADGKEEEFRGRLVDYFTLADLIWLAEAMGIDVGQFGIDKKDYI